MIFKVINQKNLMIKKEGTERDKPKLSLKIEPKPKIKSIKPHIIINEKTDLNNISIDELINSNLTNFKGKYFNKLYKNAEYEEFQENYNKINSISNSLFRYRSTNNKELYQIDEEEYNEMKKITKKERAIKSDNIMYKTTKKTENILIKSTSSNRTFKLLKIFFEIKFDTFFGQSISVIGSIDKLGNWNEYKALNMNWNEGNIWKANMDYDNINNFEYKFIFMENGNLKKWEDGINRIFSLAQIKNLLEPNLKDGNIIKLNNIMDQSIEYNYIDSSLTIISEWNKKTM